MIDVLNGGKTSKISFLTRGFLLGDGTWETEDFLSEMIEVLYSPKTSKRILPHHTLDGTRSFIIVFGIAFGIVSRFNITFYHKVNQLSNGHTRINAHGLRA